MDNLEQNKVANDGSKQIKMEQEKTKTNGSAGAK